LYASLIGSNPLSSKVLKHPRNGQMAKFQQHVKDG